MVRVIPVSLKQAVSAGIGLFIALLGAKNCGLIVANDAKNCLSFGNLASPSVIVAVIGFLILLVIKVRNIPGGMILAILLIVLGLNIVFHSVKSYKASEKNSEKAAV